MPEISGFSVDQMIPPRTRSATQSHDAGSSPPVIKKRKINGGQFSEGYDVMSGNSLSQSEYNEDDNMDWRQEDTAIGGTTPGIAGRTIKRKRALKSPSRPKAETGSQRTIHQPQGAITTPPQTPCSTLRALRSSQVSVSGFGRSARRKRAGDKSLQSQSTPTITIPPFSSLLRWKDMPNPGLPQRYYAFSYASGPIHFLKVPASASRRLASHWKADSRQNYQAYIIYSFHPSAEKNNKLQGLQMVNQLAAHGFIEDRGCAIYEEMVEGRRALTFQLGEVAVSLPKLRTDKRAFRGYQPKVKVDAEDRATIAHRLQHLMHYQALPSKFHTSSSTWTISPTLPPLSATSSSSSSSFVAAAARDTTTATTAAARTPTSPSLTMPNKDGTPKVCTAPASLEASGLLKPIKVYWRHSKRIADNIEAIRSLRSDFLRFNGPSTETEDPAHHHQQQQEKEVVVVVVEKKAFKSAVIVYSNKAGKEEGINLIRRMIAARRSSVVSSVNAGNRQGRDRSMSDDEAAAAAAAPVMTTTTVGVTVCEEIMADGEIWMVYRARNRRGENYDDDDDANDDDDDGDIAPFVVGFPGRQGDSEFLDCVVQR